MQIATLWGNAQPAQASMLELHLDGCGMRSFHAVCLVLGMPVICMLLKCTLHSPSICSLRDKHNAKLSAHACITQHWPFPKVMMCACTAVGKNW